jgi:hypothetical protein
MRSIFKSNPIRKKINAALEVEKKLPELFNGNNSTIRSKNIA